MGNVIWKIAFSRTGERFVRREPSQTIRTLCHGCSVWSLEEDVNSEYQLFHIFRLMVDVWTRKKLPEYLLISCLEWTTWKKVLCTPVAQTTRYYSLHSHFLPLTSFVVFIARSINFDSIGKRQKCSRFFNRVLLTREPVSGLRKRQALQELISPAF